MEISHTCCVAVRLVRQIFCVVAEACEIGSLSLLLFYWLLGRLKHFGDCCWPEYSTWQLVGQTIPCLCGHVCVVTDVCVDVCVVTVVGQTIPCSCGHGCGDCCW